jgi:hypothetical protein
MVGRWWGEGRLEEYRTIEQGISNIELRFTGFNRIIEEDLSHLIKKSL